MSILSNVSAAIEPYALLIKVALCALLAGFLFVGGCKHGERITADKVTAANKVADTNLAAANACGDALNKITAETDASKAEAAKRQSAAEDAAKAATESAKKAQAQASAATAALEKSKSTPACAAQLKVELCPAIPLL